MSQPVVYLVDDEPICLAPMQALIKAFGYKCHAFSDAESLLESIKPVAHGMVLADYRLPRMNGLQLFEAIRAMGYELPYVIISGHVGDEEVERALQAGVTKVLHKPVPFTELQEVVDGVLAGSKLGG